MSPDDSQSNARNDAPRLRNWKAALLLAAGLFALRLHVGDPSVPPPPLIGHSAPTFNLALHWCRWEFGITRVQPRSTNSEGAPPPADGRRQVINSHARTARLISIDMIRIGAIKVIVG
jgi:hypothetical protein